MRHLSSRLGAILINAMWATRLLAADTPDCADCAVANAVAAASQADEHASPGLRAGGGYWLLSAQFANLETASVGGPARLHNDSNGTYLLADGRHMFGTKPVDDIELFLRERAIKDPGNPIGEYVGASILYRSAGVEGWRRQLGVAVGIAELATPFQRALSESGIGVAEREAIYELSYRVEVSEGFAVQSDLQFVRNPGMDVAVDSSWTIGLRFEIGAR